MRRRSFSCCVERNFSNASLLLSLSHLFSKPKHCRIASCASFAEHFFVIGNPIRLKWASSSQFPILVNLKALSPLYAPPLHRFAVKFLIAACASFAEHFFVIGNPITKKTIFHAIIAQKIVFYPYYSYLLAAFSLDMALESAASFRWYS